MTDNELLTLADREAQRLSDENDHGPAIIIWSLVKRIRDGREPTLSEEQVIDVVRRRFGELIREYDQRRK